MKRLAILTLFVWVALLGKGASDVSVGLEADELHGMVIVCSQSNRTRFYECLDAIVARCRQEVRGVRFEMINAQDFCEREIKTILANVLNHSSRMDAGLGWKEK